VDLPKGWIKTELQFVGEIVTGKTPSKKNTDFYGGNCLLVKPGDLDKEIIVSSTQDRLTELGLENAPAIPAGSIMVTCIGNMGKVGIASQRLATNQQINSIVPNKKIVESRYLFYYTKTLKSWLEQESSATTISIINKSKFSTAPIILPPLNEQKRIAKKLDELLATVESIKTRLDKAPTIIKRFRQSILAAATSGKLTEEWREENGIDEEWKALTVDDVATVGTGNTPLKSNTSFYENGDIPWLTSSVTGSPFVYETDKFVTQQAIDECRLKLYESGTLLVAMYGEGKTRGQVTELTFPASINQACAAIVVDEDKIEKSYLKMRLQENYAAIRLLAEGGNQPNLNLSKVRSITVPTPSTDEQKEIVSQVESLFALADTLEAKIEASQKHVDKLTQSILAKAFRGELVEQDTNDEPAEKLLERIRAEQESVKPKKVRRKRGSCGINV